MTERLYYNNSYLTEFEARVVEKLPAEQGIGVVLDRTAFYPTGGGQPYDAGTLNGVPVLDVIETEEGTILHIVKGDITSQTVLGKIDWSRRFDHMQQHSGQHILSQAFVTATGAQTVSFHLGSEVCTIDVALDRPTADQIQQAEELANKVIFEDRPLTVRTYTQSEVEQLKLRKETQRVGDIRVVDIQDFDMTPCGGTHVRRTGEVGLIAVCGFEKAKGLCRVEFRCGQRALRGFRSLNETVTALSRALTTSPADLPRMVAKLIEENKEKHRRIQTLTDQVLALEARARYADAPDRDGIRLITSVFTGRDISEVKTLALKLIGLPSALVLFAVRGEPTQVFFGRSADLNPDMAALLRKACQEFGGRGGGRPDLAQGGGIPSDKVDAFLQFAEEHLST